jgi:hypothetical protein
MVIHVFFVCIPCLQVEVSKCDNNNHENQMGECMESIDYSQDRLQVGSGSSAAWCILLLFAFPGAVQGGFGSSQSTEVENVLFSDASSCARCHDNLLDDEGEDLSFVEQWSTTMMRFSFHDPFWRAKVRSESLRLNEYSSDVERKCIRCHAPMASEQALFDEEPLVLFDDGGLLDEENTYHELAIQGVGCTLCHQIKEDSGDSGEFVVGIDSVAWGPYNPRFATTMSRASGYLPAEGPHVMDSQFCATCHDLDTDYYDQYGEKKSTDETLFPEQAPYKEWLESSYPGEDKHCQYCHMDSSGNVRIAAHPNRTAPREDVRGHTFLTENTMMLNIIASIAEGEGLELPDLDDAVADGHEYMAGAGTVKIVEYDWSNNDLTVTLDIINHAGHKLPTSIPVRRAFIHFAVYDEDGEVIFSSGDTDDIGKIVGVDADEDHSTYEPHYDVISSEDQVQVYEGIMRNWEGETTYTLLRAAGFLKDNRILPNGFDKANGLALIRPVGAALEDDDFIGGQDSITYKVSGVSGNEIRIEAELKDQTLAYTMVHDLEHDLNGDNEVDTTVIDQFLSEYDHHKVHYELIDSTSMVLRRAKEKSDSGDD